LIRGRRGIYEPVGHFGNSVFASIVTDANESIGNVEYCWAWDAEYNFVLSEICGGNLNTISKDAM
jgi:hypothetical protein